MPTDGFSIKPRKVKLLAGEQKATEFPLVGDLDGELITGPALQNLSRPRGQFSKSKAIS